MRSRCISQVSVTSPALQARPHREGDTVIPKRRAIGQWRSWRAPARSARDVDRGKVTYGCGDPVMRRVVDNRNKEEREHHL